MLKKKTFFENWGYPNTVWFGENRVNDLPKACEILNIKKYEDRGFPFSSWLYRIASNEVNLFYRKSKKVTEVEIMETDVITLMKEIKEGDEVDRQQVVIKCLGDLSIEVSHLIELRFFDRMSFKEMGEVLGITHGNAKIRLYRALDKLKKLVEEQGI